MKLSRRSPTRTPIQIPPENSNGEPCGLLSCTIQRMRPGPYQPLLFRREMLILGSLPIWKTTRTNSLTRFGDLLKCSSSMSTSSSSASTSSSMNPMARRQHNPVLNAPNSHGSVGAAARRIWVESQAICLSTLAFSPAPHCCQRFLRSKTRNITASSASARPLA